MMTEVRGNSELPSSNTPPGQSGFWRKLWDRLKDEIVRHVAIVIIASVPVGIAIGWALFAVPTGAVMAFNLKGHRCPNGWVLYEAAGGRVIVGAGPHQNSGVPSYLSHADNKSEGTGGVADFVLTSSQIPSHTHSGPNGLSFWTWKSTPGHSGQFPGTNDGRTIHPGDTAHITGDIVRNSGFTSQEKVNNMQPFVSLHYCEKVRLIDLLAK